MGEVENFLYPLWVGLQKTALSHHTAYTSLSLESHVFLVLRYDVPQEGMPVVSLCNNLYFRVWG